jgi:pimeloyl-ACP methyl ester carboxylesterase
MVGHSLGSYESLLFTDRHTKDVVGMVLVDPSVPDQLALEQRIAPLFAQEDSAEQPLVKIYRRCAADMRAGTAKNGGPDPDHCLAYPSFFPAELGRALRAKVINPVQYETMASFMTSFAEDAKIVVNPGRNYGDMPLVVLTATVRTLPPGVSDEERAENAAFDTALNGAHDLLAGLSTRGVNVHVPGANHYIQRSRPQAVIDAVAAVVAEACERKSR